jgi:hypothetical protein
MIAELHDAGIRLSRNGDRLHVEAAPGILTADVRLHLIAHKAELLAALNNDPEARLHSTIRAQGLPDHIAALSDASPGDLDALSNDALAAYARALRDTELRRRGKVPADETAAALCLHCGPVWIAPEVADAAPKVNGWPRLLGCPWCHVPKDGVLAMPRPSTRCESCRYFKCDTVNPEGGAGRCMAGMNPARPWPKAQQDCARWNPSNLESERSNEL